MQQSLIVLGNKVDSNSLSTESPRAANTVQVVFGVVWQIVVDHQRHLLHINATCQQIGGDQHTRGARSKFSHNDVSGILVHITVSGGHGMVTLSHLVGEPVDFTTGVCEDNALGDGQRLVEIAQGIKLPFFFIDIDVELLDTFQGELITLDENTDWLVHELASNFQCFRWESSGENTHLDFGWEQLEYIINLVLETATEHFICLVKDEHLDGIGLESAATEHVVDATRSADDDVNAGLEGTSVLADGGTTDAGVALDVEVVTQGSHDLFDLLGKLSGGGENEGLALEDVVIEILEDAGAEGGGLAGTRLGLLDDIETLAEGDDTFLLDS